jgi:hypothetical protein
MTCEEAHAQRFFGSNVWVPTVHESVHVTNPQRASGLPRIAVTMGLDGHMDSSAILCHDDSCCGCARVQERRDRLKQQQPAPPRHCEVSEEGQGDGGWQRLCPDTLAVPSVPPPHGEAAPQGSRLS